MANPVIITRPLAQAGSMARQLAAMGRNAVVFPLLEIHPLRDPAQLRAALDELAGYAMVAFVSPNAIDAAFSVLPNWPKEIGLAVMGEGSRAALARHGVTDATHKIVSPDNPQRTDSQTLLEQLDLGGLQGQRVLIIRGESGRELLADVLRAAGAQVTQVAAYRRTAPTMDQARRTQLRNLVESENDWIVTSSEALRILVQMVQQVADRSGVVKMQQQHIIVPHIRIEETARLLGFRDITLTGSGDERLLAALQSPA
jgi:uroporphyrinogen-III synthase